MPYWGQMVLGNPPCCAFWPGCLSPMPAGCVCPEESGQVGYLPQRPYGFQRSVLKNVTMALSSSHPRPEEAALAALGRVGMENMARENGSRLSGGETQRMAFARMIVRSRKLLLLDEPTSATDIAGNDLVEAALLEYQRETGCTVAHGHPFPGSGGAPMPADDLSPSRGDRSGGSHSPTAGRAGGSLPKGIFSTLAYLIAKKRHRNSDALFFIRSPRAKRPLPS